jgi:hypothetical protein
MEVTYIYGWNGLATQLLRTGASQTVIGRSRRSGERYMDGAQSCQTGPIKKIVCAQMCIGKNFDHENASTNAKADVVLYFLKNDVNSCPPISHLFTTLV